MQRIAIILITALSLSSCVSSKVHKELQAKCKAMEVENTDLRKENEQLTASLQQTESELARLKKEMETMTKDTLTLGSKYRKLKDNFAELNKSYEFLLENNNALLASNQNENKKLMDRLNKLQVELQAKEDSLNTEQDRMAYLSQELQKREARVYELESLISRKDSTVNYVRKRISDALLNFNGKGLTIEQRNGKVYVSLENSLLFPSASWTVDQKGKQALEQLAVVLAENPDLNVMVEGHTDNDEFNGRTAVKDNWDLSVMRATSIVKILTANPGVDPKKITAAGRSEYLPLVPNDSPEGKAKNRRTDIIITPNLGELVDLLEEVK
ncbi:MAG TPA: cell envelope biogenesis protein OmpA [Cryomorphaceae bacterium]|nr:cell envelope biogenesis protein OmpA [Owenweeksia sp.]MBG00542.1 cell envelope biogenesis protein OmpA [Owenweeksia sp.]HAD96160.1 cell envelope biogenesis protein OmpA [Cryomorphaceae bacterium]HCQ15757.1 cell envelope biogenesis protein OmpA [Cryomorphaceae bacterium]|tara:strand:- start:6301 stop:7281 length:981 start_codon:yes stop_codon:yes gene_type:complete